MTQSFNVVLTQFDERYIEDIAMTIAHIMHPLKLSREMLEDLPFTVASETDARTAFRIQQSLIKFPGVGVSIVDEDTNKVVINLDNITLHYSIVFYKNGRQTLQEDELVSPLIARRELGLKASEPEQEPPQQRTVPVILSPIELAHLVLDFAAEHKHAYPAAGNFIRSILTDY